ncbi:MAG: ABC transporter substrate-binding protein [Kordiimonadaceae bacterium]|nr:ABC transporter substrate-binding protein [Kordiimonadaceae bacterium]MBO6567108.1 ABC transporter substrate-binding protein [Kordiimonadaceae bacterium]MBO6963677.1 ABC transporter substrate-binding protein [Kordiimonadaceae bacterium]
MMKPFKLLILFATTCWSIAATADDKPIASNHIDVSVGSMSIPFAYEQNGTGVYNQIFDKLVEGYEGTVDVTFFPSNRLSRAVEGRQIDCLYIATESVANNGGANSPYRELEFIGPVNLVSVVVYLPANADDVNEITDLQGLKIASDVNLVPLINRLGIQEDFDLQSQIQMIELLVAGRVDALIGYDFDLDFLTRKQGVRDQLKKASIKLLTIGDGIACFSNERLKPFRDHMKARLKHMTDSGWLDDALKDYR